MPPLRNRLGDRTGRLKVIRLHSTKPVRWLCQCDCGNQIVLKSGALYGNTQSCGCIAREATTRRNFKHGLSKSREYRSWVKAKCRCYNPKDPKYKDYGGRGISMCERWIGDFLAFMSDLGPCPPGMTIERNDVNGNYEPKNCRWATPKEQSNNKRCNRIVEINGEALTLAQWRDRTGIGQDTLAYRLKHYPIDKVCSKIDLRAGRKFRKPVTEEARKARSERMHARWTALRSMSSNG